MVERRPSGPSSLNATGLEETLTYLEELYDVREAKTLIEHRPGHYNTVCPHTSLGYKAPAPETILSADLDSTMWRFRLNWPSFRGAPMIA